jgi:photosystem II stability/assembly factor-like uncharacterized protein
MTPIEIVCRALLWLFAICLIGRSAFCEPRAATERAALPTMTPSPIQDDANLHDVQFLDGRIGWAVGDHGVIWRTADGGRDWRLLRSPADCPLRSVCFLSDRVGWIVGGATMPFTRLGIGIVLATTDGGRTWTELGRGRLPQLHSVRFFSLSEGVLVGEATAEFPTGVIVTHDGGKTWLAVEGARRSGWRAADFLRPDAGVAAGLDGTTARVDGGKLVDIRAGGFGPRGLYGVKLGADDDGWIVGDGALVLHSVNRGVVWQSAPSPLPEDAADIFNFRAVALRGQNVWIAGTPGSVVWHSPDGGRNWNAQRTGQRAPIERLFFSSEKTGWAVGAFANILRTDDGGNSWRAQHGGDRRAALLSLEPRGGEISFGLLARQSAELGYRSVVVLPFRSGEEGAATPRAEFDLRLHDAVTSAGGSQGSIGWRLPLDVPGLDRDTDKLIAEWMRRTEGRLRETFFGNLVCQIRTWRPSVIIVDEPTPGDAAADVLAKGVLEAVRQAADPTCFPAQRDLAALEPWKTSRVFARLPAGSGGDFVIHKHETLPHIGLTVATVAAAAASRLVPVDAEAPETEAFRLVAPTRDSGAPDPADAALADFFTGLAVGPDGRRPLTAAVEVNEQALRQAERDRNFRAILKQRTKTPSHGAELLAMLRTSLQGTDRTTASLQLANLADAYRRNGQWELAEAAFVELVDRYPNEPATLDAMRWLLQFWTGAELTYQRFRVPETQKERLEFKSAPVAETIQKAIDLAQSDIKTREPIEQVSAADPAVRAMQPGQLRIRGKQDWHELELKNQRDRALRMAQLIRRKSPVFFRSPEIQLPLASLLRQSGLTALPADRSARLLPGVKNDALADGGPIRLDFATQKTVNCAATSEPPHLDGLLSDTCWQQAVEIPLTPESTSLAADAPHAFALVAHDKDSLYFAMSIPRVRGVRTDGVMTYGRKHDQDLSPFDRVALCFDVDRDFVTWYQIEIDQRGCVAESCWNDSAWNPTMGVAAAADDDRWRIEGAIPFSELVPRRPQAGEQWGLAVLRTVPAVRLESWCHPAAVRPRPETFGVLRFQ